MSRSRRRRQRESLDQPASPGFSHKRRWLVIAVLALIAALGIWWRGGQWGHLAARRALREREPERAIDWLRWTGRYFGPNAETHLLFARSYRKLGQLPACQESLQLAMASGGDEAQLLREQVLLRAQAGEFRESEPYLSKLMAEPLGDEADILESFVIGLMTNGQVAEVAKVLDSWQQKLPNDPQPHFYYGLMHRDIGWPTKAMDEFRQTLQRDPQHPGASFELAVQLMRSHQFDEAMPLYRVAIAKHWNEEQSRVGLAHCLRMECDVVGARDVLEPLLQGSRPHIGAMAEMGSVELMDGRYEAALKWMERALAVIPRNSELNYAYASTLAALGRHGEAATPFEFAIEARRSVRRIAELSERVNARPDDVAARCEIARLALDYGDPREALGWIQSVLQRDPNHEQARQLLARLQALAAPPPAPSSPPALPPPGTPGPVPPGSTKLPPSTK